MPLPFHLGLRNNRHMVTVLKSGAREVLGQAHPETVDRRLRILEQWGTPAPSPRQVDRPTIDLPLPLRTQSILSHELDPAMQSRLSGAPSPLRQSRRAAESSSTERLHLGGRGRHDSPASPAVRIHSLLRRF